MGTPIPVVNVVRVAKDLLGVARVPLERDLEADWKSTTLLGMLGDDVNDLVVDRLLGLVEKLDELPNAPLVFEDLGPSAAPLVG